MTFRLIILVIFVLAYILFMLFQDKLKLSSKWKKGILIILSIVIIPWCVSEATGFKASENIKSLEEIIKNLRSKLIEQETVLKDISSKIYVALENKCLEDLEERKSVIKKLHDNSFQTSKTSYDNIVDSIFKEVEELHEKKEQLSTEQKILSDKSLIYFEILTNYVLGKFDNIIAQLRSKEEVINVENIEIPQGYFYADNGEGIIVRKIELKNNRKIEFQIKNRRINKGKLVSLPSIEIIPNGHSPRIYIVGPPIKKLEVVPRGGFAKGGGGNLEIKYPLGEDPLMSDSFRNSIDQKLSDFIKFLYF